jgi:hypothetical protein
MSITEKVKWGKRDVVSWILFAASVFVICYLVWLFLQSGARTGEACLKNQDCKSDICYYEDGRHLRYCTVRCESDAQCPEGWRCFQPPNMQNMFLCLRK